MITLKTLNDMSELLAALKDADKMQKIVDDLAAINKSRSDDIDKREAALNERSAAVEQKNAEAMTLLYQRNALNDRIIEVNDWEGKLNMRETSLKDREVKLTADQGVLRDERIALDADKEAFDTDRAKLDADIARHADEAIQLAIDKEAFAEKVAALRTYTQKV